MPVLRGRAAREPMQNADGDYLCIDCNGGTYGPETG